MKISPQLAVLIAAAVMFILPCGELFSQQNPFLSTDSGKTSAEVSDKSSLKGFNPFINSSFMQSIRNAQKKFQSWISEYITDYRSSGEIRTLFRFLLFSFLYGLLHVLGPGHRKIFLFSYFISQPSRWKQGMLAGFMTAVLHAVSAVLFIGGLYVITSRALLSRFNDITPFLELISYSAIIAVGVYIIVKQILGSRRRPDTMLFIIASGMIPCPGAATIMIFSIAVAAPLVGVYAVLAMSLGMAAVLTLVPPAAILLRNRIMPLISKWNPAAGERIHRGLSILGAVVLILFGLIFIV